MEENNYLYILMEATTLGTRNKWSVDVDIKAKIFRII